MTIGVLKEPGHETRVSLLPEGVAALTKKKSTVLVEPLAGEKASGIDAEYEKAGAQIKSRNEVLNTSDIILCIHPPNLSELKSAAGKILIGVYQPLFHQTLMEEWAQIGVTSFSLDMLPRTTRAQSMDVLSSQANIAGYKAVLWQPILIRVIFPCS